jgi:hypothetical protein
LLPEAVFNVKDFPRLLAALRDFEPLEEAASFFPPVNVALAAFGLFAFAAAPESLGDGFERRLLPLP